MDKIIGLKHESDLVDLLLSLEEGEEYMMMDEECKRLFQLTELEKSQLGKDKDNIICLINIGVNRN